MGEQTKKKQPIFTKDGQFYPWENILMPDVYGTIDIEDICVSKDSVIQWVMEH